MTKILTSLSFTLLFLGLNSKAAAPLVKVYECVSMPVVPASGEVIEIYAIPGSPEFRVQLVSMGTISQDIESDRVLGGYDHFVDHQTGGSILKLDITGQPTESARGFFSLLTNNGEISNWACQPLN